MNGRAGRPDKRGNNTDRRRRKLWLLKVYGDGETCKCVHCGKVIDYETLEADRITPGGTYRHENIQPSCRACNIARSDDPYWVCLTPWDESIYEQAQYDRYVDRLAENERLTA